MSSDITSREFAQEFEKYAAFLRTTYENFVRQTKVKRLVVDQGAQRFADDRLHCFWAVLEHSQVSIIVPAATWQVNMLLPVVDDALIMITPGEKINRQRVTLRGVYQDFKNTLDVSYGRFLIHTHVLEPQFDDLDQGQFELSPAHLASPIDLSPRGLYARVERTQKDQPQQGQFELLVNGSLRYSFVTLNHSELRFTLSAGKFELRPE